MSDALATAIVAGITGYAIAGANEPSEAPKTCDFAVFGDGESQIPSTVTQSQAHVFYSCKYFQAVERNAQFQRILAIIQSLTDLYFANQQYKTAERAQKRLDDLAQRQNDMSDELFARFAWSHDCEKKALTEACMVDVQQPRYEEVKARVTSEVRRLYSRSQQKLRRQFSANCMAFSCSEQRRMETEMNSQIAIRTEEAWRREEARFRQDKAAARAERMAMLQHVRGHVSDSLAAIKAAATVSATSASINPHAGWENAVNRIAGRFSSLSAMDAGMYGAALQTAPMAYAMQGTGVTAPLINGSQGWGVSNVSQQTHQSVQQTATMLDGNGLVSPTRVTNQRGFTGLSMPVQDAGALSLTQ